MAATSGGQAAPFILDDRTLERRLDAFREYCKLIPFVDEENVLNQQNWAHILLGEAGGNNSEPDWAEERARLSRLYESPADANGLLPPERVFLLAVLGLLETPRGLINALPAQYRDLYYREQLALTERPAYPDTVVVRFTLDEGVRECEVPAGLRLDAGQDSRCVPIQYGLLEPMVVSSARVTDLRWVVNDRTRPSGRRARVVWDEAAGIAWPAAGLRLFDASPLHTGEPVRADADRDVLQGRVVGSPVLAVSGGMRTWTVTFDTAIPENVEMTAELSIGEQWVKLDCGIPGKSCVVKLAADGGQPTPVADLDGFTSTTPLMRLTLSNGVAVPKITQIHVHVQGAQGIHCTTDDGVELTAAGGLPFGEMAAAGAGLNLISEEWWRLSNLIQSITLVPTWQGLPTKSFYAWYGADPEQAKDDWFRLDHRSGKVSSSGVPQHDVKKDIGYVSDTPNNRDFMVNASIVKCDGQVGSVEDDISLFYDAPFAYAPDGVPLVLNKICGSFPVAKQGALVPNSDNPTDWPWHVRLALTRSFMLAEYQAHLEAPPQVISFEVETSVPVQKFETEIDGRIKVDAATHLPIMARGTPNLSYIIPVVVPKANWNPAYRPQWSGLTVNYEALDAKVTNQQILTPFGHGGSDDATAPIAELYLGVDRIEAHQALNLYWKFDQAAPVKVEWQYLAGGERWHGLGAAVRDRTDGFARSGGWTLEWPRDASLNATSLPSGRYWLRGRVTPSALTEVEVKSDRASNIPAFGWLTALVTNAGEATLLQADTVEPAHFTQALPPGKVTQALDAPAGLEGVTQPWPSYGGRAVESAAAFYARVARRLRHRDRALNNVDMTTLLSEYDPGLREMTVLDPRPTEDGSLAQTIVVMPRIGDGLDPRRPAYRSDRLKALARWLMQRGSPWLHVSCVNPEYVDVTVSWTIEYEAGVSYALGEARVTAALERAYVPWRQPDDDNSVMVLGRAISHAGVREVIRHVPGVKTVTGVRLNGDAEHDAVPRANQIGVIRCIPREYDCVSVAWLGTDKSRWGKAELRADGQQQVVLQVTLPKTDARNDVNASNAKVTLVDCDTGEPLYSGGVSECGARVGVLTGQDTVSQVLVDNFEEARESVPANTIVRSFFIYAGTGAAGVKRIGAAIELTVNSSHVTLLSAQVQQSVRLSVHPVVRT
ncbi:hypothetical protein [Burkholderia sp. SIMBA_062]|uniref:hypothetical protein n=1 Tax=Burkholderia sp. SIMBA_062 TaxID=3085803 RepID=UPI00397A6699